MGKMEFVNPTPMAQFYGQRENVIYEPKDGLMLLFPSMQEHLVHPNQTKNPRVLISFNINVQPIVQQPQTISIG